MVINKGGASSALANRAYNGIIKAFYMVFGILFIHSITLPRLIL
jgi:hypothetical protein